MSCSILSLQLDLLVASLLFKYKASRIVACHWNFWSIKLRDIIVFITYFTYFLSSIKNKEIVT